MSRTRVQIPLSALLVVFIFKFIFMKWTKEDDQKLLDAFNKKMTYKEMSLLLNNRTERAVRARLNKFGHKTSDVYEKKFVNCICKTCGDSFLKKESQFKKTKYHFCSHSCAATFNNLNLARNIKGINGSLRIKWVEGINGSLRIKRVDRFCKNCNKKLKKQKTFCSNKCQGQFTKKENFKKIEKTDNSLSERRYKEYLINKFGGKCMKCGWDKKHPVTGKVPIQMNHKDGNSENNSLHNLELLCPNCHSLTPNYGALNTGKGRTKRKEYRNKQKKEKGFYV